LLHVSLSVVAGYSPWVVEKADMTYGLSSLCLQSHRLAAMPMEGMWWLSLLMSN
jgi:hypothetical protein